MKIICIVLTLLFSCLFSSGGFDNGTSAGKDRLELDITWNPFNYFKQGQSYAVFSYGLQNRFDLHGYYSIHTEGFHTYYIGLFYQFFSSKKLDLATAVGSRQNRTTKLNDIFFPQILYTINFNNNYAIGGSFVNIIQSNNNKVNDFPIAIDIALLVPIEKFFKLPKNISDIKLALGMFNPVTNSSIAKGKFIPTYSIDIKFKGP
tara:strand:+ start:18208 stop:18819 length:612 start_codon:yes stop_codon:yes gene_type:complete